MSEALAQSKQHSLVVLRVVALLRVVLLMAASTLHHILGEGDDKTWKEFTEHEHSFLFAAVVDQKQVESLHELVWDRNRPRAKATGALGYVRCRQNSAAGESLSLTSAFRVHVCRQWPCTAQYHPSKYGGYPPPLRHGKIVRLCDVSEKVTIETEWRYLLEHIEPVGLGGMASKTAPSQDVKAGDTAAAALGATGEAQTASAVAELNMTSTSAAPVSTTHPGDATLFQDDAISAANAVGTRAEAEQGMTSASDAMSLPTSAVAEGAAPPMSDDAEARRMAILARADRIGNAGVWIGCLEIMAFAAMNKQRVLVQFVEGETDVVGGLNPQVMDATWSLWPFPGRIVACHMVHGEWFLAGWANCTHYVAAMPLEDTLGLGGHGVVAQLGRLGYATVFTVTNGDCGIESLLILANRRRGPAERIALRRSLAEFLRASAAAPAWHDAWGAAGELLPEKVNLEKQADIRGGGADTRTQVAKGTSSGSAGA